MMLIQKRSFRFGMKMKKCLGLISAIGILVFQAGCGQLLNATVGGNMETPRNTVATEASPYEITEADRNMRGDNPIDVTLEEIPGGLLQITEAGTYRISGNTSNGKIIVKAKNNGVRGNDGVVIEDSIVDIQSEGIGIKTISDKDFVVIKGGECKIIAGENVICSENYVLIEDCVKDFHSVEEVIRCNGEKHINEM